MTAEVARPVAVETDALLSELRAAVGDAHVLTDPDLTAGYETDWTRRFSGRSLAVVRPASTDEVSAVMRACTAAGAQVVVQGGNTGLVGGGVPRGGEVLLSTTRLTRIGEVDPLSGQVGADAGVTLASLQQVVRAAGFDVGVDFAARDSCSVGGLVATNAGGEKVLRHGGVRAQVVGVEAVLADGSVISRLSGLAKDNTGYDLSGLLCGSEGTLAVVTHVRWRLVPLLTERVVALLGVTDVAVAQRALAMLRERLPMLEAGELFLADGLELVRTHTRTPAPTVDAHAAYLLVECADRTDPSERLFAVLEELTEQVEGIEDVVIAEDGPGRERLWHYREAHTESINAAGVPVKLDVALPLPVLAQALEALPAIVSGAAPTARTITFGHLAEGNLHVNVLDAGDHAEQVTDAVLRYVVSHGGSISAEHGVGRAKTAWLPLSRSAAELGAMRAVKSALDPQHLLGPGVIFD